jgi:ADP-ribosyl-[dinitrogen reductase] hydrolase
VNGAVRARIAGSLYGLLVGDALGCPVEGMGPAQIRARYDRVTDYVEGSGRRRRPIGLHSDDGQQAMALCDAVLADPQNPERPFAEQLVALLRGGDKRTASLFGLHRGTGANFRRAVTALVDAGVGADPWVGAQPSAGNGVAMMIAPLGWYFREQPATLRARVVAVARVKQSDVRGIAAAGAVAFMVARAVAGAWKEVGDSLVEFVAGVEREAAEALATDVHLHTFSTAIAAMLVARTRQRADVLQQIAKTAAATSQRRCHATSGYAVASVVTSIYLTLTATSFADLVADTVSLGGDADTTGAMVGAMGGARFGVDAIPALWLDHLCARNAFDDRLEALVSRAVGWSPNVPLFKHERAWTAAFITSRSR